MSTDRLTYRPGSWFGVFGEHASVLLPPSEKGRVAGLWQLVDDGAGFGEVLDALIAGGLRDLPAFVLVSETDGTTQVVLRGPATATFVAGGETVVLDGATAATWVERSLADVTAMTIELEEAAAYADELATAGGLVRVGRVSTGETEPAAPAAEPTDPPALAVVEPAAPVEPVVVDEPSPVVAVAEPVPADPSEGSWDNEWDDQPAEAPVADDASEQPGDTDASGSDPAWDQEWDDAPAEDQPVPPPYVPPVSDRSPWSGQETEAFAAVLSEPEESEESAESGASPAAGSGEWGEPAGQYTDHDQESSPGPSVPGSYADVDGGPALSAVAPAGSFTDSAGSPPLSAVGRTGHYTDSQGPAGAADDDDRDDGQDDDRDDDQDDAQDDAQDDDHDGMTQAGAWEPGQFARPQAGIPGQPPAPQVTSRPVARLAFSSGESVEVDRAVLIGRAPEARRFSSTDQPRLVTVPSPHQEISSTHLEIRPGSGVDHGSAVVTDMGSTNGTVLVQPGLAPEDLQPGIPVQLLPGAVVDLGDGLTITVSNP